MATPGPHVLWGVAHSYYTGKIRSYLIKKGIPYRERFVSDPEFRARVVPVIRHVVAPVLETADGQVIQETTDMIAHLEAAIPRPPMVPSSSVQKAVAWLVGAFGSEALLPAGMHYRWSYRTEQEMFLRAEFGRAMHVGPDREARYEAGRRMMDYFNGFLPMLGVTKKDKEQLQGTWAAEAGEGEGKPLAKDALKVWKIVINRDDINLQGVKFIGYSLDPSKTPKAIDIWTLDLPLQGIYKVEKDKLH